MSAPIGELFALLTACAWAHNSIIYSMVGKEVSSSTTTHIRLWIALPAIFLINRMFTGIWIPRVETDVLLIVGLSGLLGYCVADLFIFNSYLRIGPRNTMLIMTLSPVFSLILSRVFLGETIIPAQGIGILVTIVGIAWVILEKEGNSPRTRNVLLGIIFSTAGAFFQSAGVVLSKLGMSGGLHPVSTNLIRIFAGLIGLIVFTSIRGTFIEDFRKMKGGRSLALLIQAALVGPVAGIILSLYALKTAPVGIVTTLTQLTPIILIPAERWLYKKRISIRALMGTGVALTGAAILFLV